MNGRDAIAANRNSESEYTSAATTSHKAAETLGATEVFTRDMPDNRFDTVPLLEVIKLIEADGWC